MHAEMKDRGRIMGTQKRRKVIGESSYNRIISKYKRAAGICKIQNEREIEMSVRFTCEKKKENLDFQWRTKSEKVKTCGMGKETLQHMLQKCVEIRESEVERQKTQ